ncbi:hypothetical protein, partial [Natrialba sp. INN-245]|uniref:hypothetical protein n=1 Tax=Natrialba sp. INN-245 TaxID=2690967 RepID=UPI00130FB9FB
MSAPSISWDEILPDARGYLGLEDGEPVPRNELVEQAKANGWSERETVQSLRDTDDVVPAGDGLESGLVLADELAGSSDDLEDGDGVPEGDSRDENPTLEADKTASTTSESHDTG